jgi:hypothetical protein
MMSAFGIYQMEETNTVSLDPATNSVSSWQCCIPELLEEFAQVEYLKAAMNGDGDIFSGVGEQTEETSYILAFNL